MEMVYFNETGALENYLTMTEVDVGYISCQVCGRCVQCKNCGRRTAGDVSTFIQ